MEEFKTYLPVDFLIERDISVWGIFKISLRVYQKNLATILKIALLIYIPFESLMQLMFFLAGLSVEDQLVLWVDIPAGLIADSLVFPSIVFALFAVFRGDKILSLSKSYRYGMSQWWRILKADFIVLGGVFFGMFLLIVPGVLVMVWFSLVAVVISVEGDNQPFPFARSKVLVKGKFFKVLALLFLSIIFVAPIFIVSGASTVYLELYLGEHLADLCADFLCAIAMPFLSIVMLVTYLQFMAEENAGATKPQKT